MQTITGTMTVTLDALPAQHEGHHSLQCGRMALQKTYEGKLTASASGQMLSVVTATRGSAGYVALEHVSGSLDGRIGTFVLQHTGSMNRGDEALTVIVVADSGTDELEGLQGSMVFERSGEGHSYTFRYALPTPQQA